MQLLTLVRIIFKTLTSNKRDFYGEKSFTLHSGVIAVVQPWSSFDFITLHVLQVNLSKWHTALGAAPWCMID